MIIETFIILVLLHRNEQKSGLTGKTLIELLIIAEKQMSQNDRLIHLCKLIRTIDVQKLEPWQAEGYANIIKKELSKMEHCFKI